MPTTHAMLSVFTYSFMLRMPSEALSAKLAASKKFDVTAASFVVVLDKRIGLRLAKRKNSDAPVVMWRDCCCKPDKPSATCPVHSFGNRLREQGPNVDVFKCVPKNKAIRVVRHALAVVGIRNTAAYGTHDFRRGHAYCTTCLSREPR